MTNHIGSTVDAAVVIDSDSLLRLEKIRSNCRWSDSRDGVHARGMNEDDRPLIT